MVELAQPENNTATASAIATDLSKKLSSFLMF